MTLTTNRPDGLMVPSDTFLVSQRSRIAQFAIENKLPSVYSFRKHVEVGGLIAYTPNYNDLFRRAASYVDKILKGAKAGDLPIEQASLRMMMTRQLGRLAAGFFRVPFIVLNKSPPGREGECARVG